MTTSGMCRVLAPLAFCLALVGCGGSDAPAAAGGSDGGAAAESAAVSIADLKYAPASLEVAAGTTVTWTNEDEAPHTVSFDDEAIADSDELKKSDTFETTFADAGTYSYVCAIHPAMKASVTVQ